MSNYINTYQSRDFPSGPGIKNPPSNMEDTGSIAGWGIKIPYATGQLSLHAATTESSCSRAPCSPRREMLAPYLEKPEGTTRPSTAKVNK